MLNKEGVRRYIGPKRILLCVLLFFFVGLSWYLRQQGYLNPKVIFAFIGNYPLMAPFIFIAFYALALLLMIPTLPLNLGAGMLWGSLWGSLVAMAGSGLGVIFAFTIARTAMGQPFANRFDNLTITWLQNELKTKGWKIVAFTRINPIFPSGPLNFLFGLTSISFTTYIWSSIVFLLPLTVAFAIIGCEVSNFVIEGKAGDLVRTILIVSAVITLIALFRVFTKLLTHINHLKLP
ncbi:MAG: VTT domain-containing protein [Desulfobacterales bacterium]